VGAITVICLFGKVCALAQIAIPRLPAIAAMHAPSLQLNAQFTRVSQLWAGPDPRGRKYQPDFTRYWVQFLLTENSMIANSL